MHPVILTAALTFVTMSFGTPSLAQGGADPQTSATVLTPVTQNTSAPLVVPSADRRTTRSQPVGRTRIRLQRATPETVGPNVRIAPRRILEAQLAAQDGVFVPPGYEPVWNDDRLSLTRAHQTYSGQAQMAQFWNNRTPRGLARRAEARGK